MLADYESLRQLPAAEKLHVIAFLWDDLSVSGEPVPISASLRSEIEQRVAELDRDPSATISEEELWREVDKRRG